MGHVHICRQNIHIHAVNKYFLENPNQNNITEILFSYHYTKNCEHLLKMLFRSVVCLWFLFRNRQTIHENVSELLFAYMVMIRLKDQFLAALGCSLQLYNNNGSKAINRL